MRWILLLCACSSSSGPLYAIAAGNQLYTTSSLAASTPGKGIAIEPSSLFDHSGSAWAASQMSASVTRYQLEGDTLKPAGTLSFASLGVSTSYGTRALVFVSDKKAYLLDDATLQAISFDPSAMTTGKAIDLSMLKNASYQTHFGYNLFVRGTQVVVPAYYENSSRSHVTADTSLALIDSTNDTATFVSDARCGVFSTATQVNGDLYFGTDPYSVALHRIGGNGAAPDGCLLRLKAGENLFDQGFFETVAGLTGGPPGGAAIPGPANSVWVRAFDESLFTVTATTSAEAILAAPAWRWWKIDLANPTSATQSSFAPGGGEVRYFTVEGTAWAAVAAEGSSTLFDMTSGDAPRAGLALPAQPTGIVKLR